MKQKILCLFFLLLSTKQSLFAQTTTWEKPYIGSSSDVLYLPDANAVYWRYGWTRNAHDTYGYVIKGQFPDARYFSYNIYDDNTKSSIGGITDINIQADDSKNNYTLYIVPEGTVVKGKNVLYFNKNLLKVSVILRHYLPYGDINGKKPMPKIEFFDIKNNTSKEAIASVKVPKFSIDDVDKYLIPMFNKFMEDPETNIKKLQAKEKPLNILELISQQVVAPAFNFYKEGGLIYSFNLNSEGTYPNKDNHYLTMPMIRSNSEDVCIVKFKAPKFPKTKNDFASSDVRYFSISQGDDLTYNHKTIADYEFLVNPDGFIYIVIGNESNDLKNKAKTLKMNFMPWLVKEKMLLIYRNMLPNENYKNGTNSVPIMDKTKPAAQQISNKFIGDYAPVGMFIKSSSFFNSTSIPIF